ncbi:MAG: hypothetical protein EAZ15_10235 [Sphingobacteriales bacterium]|nr:MAG: hypothetical protein EAZ15_10235 [Sphingobacteriales bacterium]
MFIRVKQPVNGSRCNQNGKFGFCNTGKSLQSF